MSVTLAKRSTEFFIVFICIQVGRLMSLIWLLQWQQIASIITIFIAQLKVLFCYGVTLCVYFMHALYETKESDADLSNMREMFESSYLYLLASFLFCIIGQYMETNILLHFFT